MVATTSAATAATPNARLFFIAPPCMGTQILHDSRVPVDGLASGFPNCRAALRRQRRASPPRTLAGQFIPNPEPAMKVQEIMTKVVAVLPPDAELSEVARVMRDYDIGSVPIADKEKLIGMVTDRDIVVRAVADGGGLNGR